MFALVSSAMSPDFMSRTASPTAELPLNALRQMPVGGRPRLNASRLPSCFSMPSRALAILIGSSGVPSIGSRKSGDPNGPMPRLVVMMIAWPSGVQ